MSNRQRKLIGAIVLIMLIVGYSVLAVSTAVVLQVRGAGRIAELVFYVVAGLLWTLPAGIIIKWMQRSAP